MLNNKSIRRIFRYSDWWNFVVPPLLSFLYIVFFINNISFESSAWNLLLFFICIVGTAGFGYFLNDVSDIQFDRIAGKVNHSAGMSVFQRILVLVLILIIAFSPWIFLNVNYLNFSLFIFQLLLLTLYSVRPFRLKKYIIPGALADSLYSGTVFILVIISTFFYRELLNSNFLKLLFFTSFIWAIFKGVRNILLHQINDRKNDKKSGLKTFVLHFKPLKTLYIIDFIILPSEIILFILLLILISFKIHVYYSWFIVFIFYTLIRFNFWKIPRLPYRQRLFKFLYFMNDYYEEWMPVVALLYLCTRNFFFIVFLILHLILFSRGISKLFYDCKCFISWLSIRK